MHYFFWSFIQTFRNLRKKICLWWPAPVIEMDSNIQNDVNLMFLWSPGLCYGHSVAMFLQSTCWMNSTLHAHVLYCDNLLCMIYCSICVSTTFSHAWNITQMWRAGTVCVGKYKYCGSELEKFTVFISEVVEWW